MTENDKNVSFSFGFNEDVPVAENDKKVSFGEEDAAKLIERYDPATILTLLQEVSRYPDAKIDWNELIKNTATGISNAREYQMLWRHLAYRDDLPENLEDGAEPMDDDSDLECELEALPPVNNETASEASACAKVMMASGILSKTGPSSSTIEAPLTINVPVCRPSTTPEENIQPSNVMQGATVIFPVTVQRQILPPVSSTEGVEAKGTAGGKSSSKRKRKAWSEEEDRQLRAGVDKYGEGNWATMLKADDFPIKRSALQLAQRWSVLRKKDGTTNSGTNLTSSQFTAEQLATRHSLSLALDMPLKKLSAPGTTNPARTPLNTSIKNPVQPSNPADASTVNSSSIQPRHPSQQVLSGPSGSPAKSIVPQQTMLKSDPSPDAAVRATAVAVGARIVSSADILSLERSAVKIMPTGNSSRKLSISAGSLTHPNAPSNVHYVCTGVSATAVAVTPASRASIVKAVSSTVENTPSCSTASELPLKQVNPTQELRVSDSSVAPKRAQADEAPVVESIPSEEILEDKSVSQNPGDSDNQGGVVENSNSNLNVETAENRHSTVDSNLDQTVNLSFNDGDHCSINEGSEDQGLNEKPEDLPTSIQDE